MFKKLLFMLIAIILSLFLILLLTESLIRLTSHSELRYNFKNWYEPDNKPGPPGPYRASSIPGLGYEIIPNAPAPSFINKYGMIGKEYRLKKDVNCFRIIAIGDSITERDWYVEKLEELLNANKSLGRRFEVWNAGVGGYNIDQYYLYLKYRLLKYNPDMVIIGMGLNDFDTSMIVCYKDSKKGILKYRFPLHSYGEWMKPNPFLFKNSYLYRLLLVQMERINDPYGKRKEERGRYYLAKIKEICKKHNVPLVCFVFSYLKPYEEYSYSEKEASKNIIGALDEFSIAHMDLAPFFPEEKRYSLRRNEDKQDYVHPNKDGHRIAAEAMYMYICNNYFRVQR